MFKYIGIRGHRGAGKNTFSYLLGAAIDYYIKNKSFDGFEAVYKKAVERVLEDEDFIEQADFKYVFFESFADTAKILLSQVIGIPVSYMYDDWCKDSVIIDIKDFSFTQALNKSELSAMLQQNNVLKAEDLKQIVEKQSIDAIEDSILITLRELITYFSKYVMQRSFGSNVWIKSLKVNKLDSERFYTINGKTMYKIFTDCKFPSEISYIINNFGTIIKVNRDNHMKCETQISEALKNDNRFDYEINFDGNLENPETFEQIKSITLKILS